MVKFSWEAWKYIWIFYDLTRQRWYETLCFGRQCSIFYISSMNIMVADGLVMQAARTWAAMDGIDLIILWHSVQHQKGWCILYHNTVGYDRKFSSLMLTLLVAVHCIRSVMPHAYMHRSYYLICIFKIWVAESIIWWFVLQKENHIQCGLYH